MFKAETFLYRQYMYYVYTLYNTRYTIDLSFYVSTASPPVDNT